MSLGLPGNSIVDIAPLQQLVKLRQVDLSRNQISDVGALTDLPELTCIDVSGNRIADVGPLVERFGRLREASPSVRAGGPKGQWYLKIRGNPITNAELLDEPWMQHVLVSGR